MSELIEKFCPVCGEIKGHTSISKKLLICSICGTETRNGRIVKNKPGEERKMNGTKKEYKRLSDEEVNQLRLEWANLQDENKTNKGMEELAEKYGCSVATIQRKLKKEGSPVRSAAATKTRKSKSPALVQKENIFREAVRQIVREELERVQTETDTKISQKIDAALSELIGGR